MQTILVGYENSVPIELYYEDHGKGPPVVLIHGWPLSGVSWEKQVTSLLAAGYRVISYDRRGFGQSSKPTMGYDYDTFTEDLYTLMTKLDLHDSALIGFSMGTGEVARYLGKYGSERVSRAVFIAPILPFLLNTPDNPNGMEGRIFEAIQNAIAADRPAFLTAFLADFYNTDVLGGNLVSNQVVQYSWSVAVGASPRGTLDCVHAWLTDFRDDLTRIDIPGLVIQGDDDRILPIAATGIRLHRALKDSRLFIVEGGPHGIIWTHADDVNAEIVDFLT